MKFKEWWNSLPNQIPHKTEDQMRLAWNAALDEAAKQTTNFRVRNAILELKEDL